MNLSLKYSWKVYEKGHFGSVLFRVVAAKEGQ